MHILGNDPMLSW